MKHIRTACIALALCLLCALPAFAVNFTPSVESKPAPELVLLTDAQGNLVTAIITDKNGNQIPLPPGVELVVTATSGKEDALDPEIRALLQRAEDQITRADHLGQLTPQLEEALTARQEADQSFEGVAVENLVARDLFDVSFVRDGAAVANLLEDGQTVTFALKTDLTEADLSFMLHNYSDDLWEVVQDVTVRDGVMTVTLGSLSPMAIAVDGGPVLSHHENGLSAVNAGARVLRQFLIGALLLAGVVGLVICLSNRRKAS